MTEHFKRVSLTVAAITALLAGGILHRALAARLSISSGEVEAVTGILNAVPYTIGQWQGQDDPLDASVVAATDAPEHISRLYRQVHGLSRVHLFASLGGRFRDLAPHRPDVCFPGAGWSFVESTQKEIPGVFNDGGALPYTRHRFRKSGFNSGEVIVLSYYALGRHVAPTLVQLMSKIRTERSVASRIVRIQVTGEPELTNPEALTDFAAKSAKLILAAAESAMHQADAGPATSTNVFSR